MRRFIYNLLVNSGMMKYIKHFPGSGDYWEKRYAKGGTSGSGSYNRLAEYKAEVLSEFVRNEGISRVIEFGCGDGNQLTLVSYPEYIGLDVAPSAIRACQQRFDNDPSKSFYLYDPFAFADNAGLFRAPLTLSLDVLFHLVEQSVFERYLQHLFESSTAWVIIYSSNYDTEQKFHERDREFTRWVEDNINGWTLVRKLDNPFSQSKDDPDNTSKSDFYFYRKTV